MPPRRSRRRASAVANRVRREAIGLPPVPVGGSSAPSPSAPPVAPPVLPAPIPPPLPDRTVLDDALELHKIPAHRQTDRDRVVVTYLRRIFMPFVACRCCGSLRRRDTLKTKPGHVPADAAALVCASCRRQSTTSVCPLHPTNGLFVDQWPVPFHDLTFMEKALVSRVAAFRSLCPLRRRTRCCLHHAAHSAR